MFLVVCSHQKFCCILIGSSVLLKLLSSSLEGFGTATGVFFLASEWSTIYQKNLSFMLPNSSLFPSFQMLIYGVQGDIRLNCCPRSFSYVSEGYLELSYFLKTYKRHSEPKVHKL